MPDENSLEPRSEIIFYQEEDGRSRIQVRLEEGTVWLSQRLISELFQKDVRTINEHLQNIFEEGELAPEATIRKFRIVQTEGNRDVSRLVDYYNLDAILAVGQGDTRLDGVQDSSCGIRHATLVVHADQAAASLQDFR